MNHESAALRGSHVSKSELHPSHRTRYRFFFNFFFFEMTLSTL
tara:strand:- start:232 stop:360 length:129 start_codon:yes stop_codon:yes gene_type:complete